MLLAIPPIAYLITLSQMMGFGLLKRLRSTDHFIVIGGG